MRRLTPFPSPGRSLLSHMKLLLLVLPLLAADEHVTVMVQPSTDCRFSVHKGGPEGEELTGVDLDSEIYYSIRCAPQKGFCLKVSNCTVSADDGSVEPFTVIDERGCSSDTSIFGHVEYESDFTAGIPNPYPIRFRSSSAAVLFYCVTTLEPSAGICYHKPCPKGL